MALWEINLGRGTDLEEEFIVLLAQIVPDRRYLFGLREKKGGIPNNLISDLRMENVLAAAMQTFF